MVSYFLRKPKFPLLIETDNRVYGVENEVDLVEIIKRTNHSKKTSYSVVDSTGEGWSFVPSLTTISPLTVKKKWFKKEIIELFNSSLKEAKIEKRYIPPNLSNNTVGKIVNDIVVFDLALTSK
mgnify:CR=1 FL=1